MKKLSVLPQGILIAFKSMGAWYPGLIMAASVYFQAAMDFVLMGLAIWMLIHWSIVFPSLKSLLYEARGTIVLIGFFFAWAILSIVLAPHFAFSDLKSLFHFQNFVHMILLAAGLRTMSIDKGHYLKTARLILLLIWLPALYGISQFARGYDPLFERDTSRMLGSLNSATYHAHNMSLVLAFVTPAVLWWMKESIGKKSALLYRLSMMISYVLGLVSVYLTYTRGAWIGLAAGLVVSWVTIEGKGLKLSLLAGGVITLILLIFFEPRFVERLKQSVDGDTDAARKSLLLSHIDMFLDRPVLGQGYMQYKKEIVSYPFTGRYSAIQAEDLRNSHAHNQYLQMLSSLGVVGLLLFVATLGHFFYLTRKVISQEPEVKLFRLGTFSFLVTMIVLFFTDQTFEYFLSRESISAVWGLILFQSGNRKSA